MEKSETIWALLSAIASIIAIFLSYKQLSNFRDTEKKLVKLLKDNDDIARKFRDEINKEFDDYQKGIIKAKAVGFPDKEEEKVFIETQKNMLEYSLTTLQLKFLTDVLDDVHLKKNVNKNENNFNNQDKLEIIKTLKNSNFENRVNYWNSILKKSGFEKLHVEVK